MGHITFLRRAPKEVEIFGGEIFFDIDGKNAGKLSSDDIMIDLPAGPHTIKMYKSHTYDTFIGFAEVQVDISLNEHLLARYSPPMIVHQAGNIVLTNYNTYTVDHIAQERENKIENDYQREERRKQEANEKYKKGVITVIVIVVIISIIWGIAQASIWWW